MLIIVIIFQVVVILIMRAVITIVRIRRIMLILKLKMLSKIILVVLTGTRQLSLLVFTGLTTLANARLSGMAMSCAQQAMRDTILRNLSIITTIIAIVLFSSIKF